MSRPTSVPPAVRREAFELGEAAAAEAFALGTDTRQSRFGGNVLANLKPGHQETWVEYHNQDRAQLLFISGGDDQMMPPSVQRSNAKHYKGDTASEVVELGGRAHLMPAQDGWEEVADYALSWAVAHKRQAPAAA